MAESVEKLVQAANDAARNGRWLEAEKSWQQVLDVEPGNAKALCSLGIHALHRGDNEIARDRLAKARRSAPQDFIILMALSNACRQLQDMAGEREAVDAALTLDPYFLPAHLARADWLERHGDANTAAAAYKHALRLCPPEASWPPEYRQQLEHAKDVVTRHATALGQHLAEKLGDETTQLSPELAARWREAVAIRAGQSEPYVSNSNQLHIPRLPAIPFFDREQFQGLRELEAETDAIRDELLMLLKNRRSEFVPYIAYRAGDPVNQWSELNHSDRWSALHLWKSGQAVSENLALCPRTARALQQLRMADIDGLCPNVLFSALAPHTRIPPHHGETNARVVAHLPLIVPEGCRYRVGYEQRQWEVGKCLIFDDTLQHEAVNDSDELRVVLIFDLWNPLLSEVERKLASLLAKSTREFAAAGVV